MPSEKATMILLSKTDMTREEIGSLSDAAAWKIIYSTRAKKAQSNCLQVCFTGFGSSKKEELMQLASSSGKFKTVGSVTKNLDFLVGGDNAGPKKIEKAEEQGVQFLTEEQFIRLVQTGEVP